MRGAEALDDSRLGVCLWREPGVAFKRRDRTTAGHEDAERGPTSCTSAGSGSQAKTRLRRRRPFLYPADAFVAVPLELDEPHAATPKAAASAVTYSSKNGVAQPCHRRTRRHLSAPHAGRADTQRHSATDA